MVDDVVTVSDVSIEGSFDEAFRGVRDAFEQGFISGEEVGASISIVVEGQTVVDLWGGFQDRERTKPWVPETIVCCMSCSKGITAICIAMAIDRGLLSLDEPVATYWPEFAVNGKSDIPLRYVLDHRAGLPYVENLPAGSIHDFDAIVTQLATQAPLWEPGTASAYHVLTQGFLLGEILRRVTGKKVGQFLREELAGPLGAEFAIGLTDAEQDLCADFLVAPEVFAKRGVDPTSILSRGWDQMPEGDMEESHNSKAWREADVASASGHGNGRGLARIWGAVANGGTIDGIRILSEGAVRMLGTQQHELVEQRHNRPYRQGLGVQLTTEPIMNYGPNPNAFGHGGVGGSLGFADPDLRMGFGYAPNNMNATPDMGARGFRLTRAAYAALGWT